MPLELNKTGVQASNSSFICSNGLLNFLEPLDNALSLFSKKVLSYRLINFRNYCLKQGGNQCTIRQPEGDNRI